MKPYGKAFKGLSGTLYKAGEGLPGVPVVELAGDGRVLIEHHRGVVEYGTQKICVKVKYGLLCICGMGMELAKMTKDQLVNTGRIGSITIQRKG